MANQGTRRSCRLTTRSTGPLAGGAGAPSARGRLAWFIRPHTSRHREKVDRRCFIRDLAAILVIEPLVARGQTAKRTYLIGVLSPGPTLRPSEYQGVWTPLRSLGWVEGENLRFERRWAEGKPERLRSLADELVRIHVDIIVTIGTDATVAARDATATIPIVMLSAADPVGTGLVESLARPGRNVTGISMVGPDIEAKRLALLREVVPNARRVGVLVDPKTTVSGYSRGESEATYQRLGLEPIFVEVSAREKLDEAVTEMARRRVQAVIVHRSVLFSLNAQTIMDAALAHSLPVCVEDRGMLEAGGLMSYTIDDLDQLRHFATFVDRILRGAKPADLPVEQPTRFVLAINLKIAKVLGLTIPQSVLLRANDVIR